MTATDSVNGTSASTLIAIAGTPTAAGGGSGPASGAGGGNAGGGVATGVSPVLAASGSSATPATAAGGSGPLAFTGADIATTVGVGSLALALGGFLMLIAKRRRLARTTVS
jgi:hypothetical protein